MGTVMIQLWTVLPFILLSGAFLPSSQRLVTLEIPPLQEKPEKVLVLNRCSPSNDRYQPRFKKRSPWMWDGDFWSNPKRNEEKGDDIGLLRFGKRGGTDEYY